MSNIINELNNSLYGYIYIIYNPSYSIIPNTNIFKIGISNNPKRRLKELSTGHLLESYIVWISKLCLNYRDCDSSIKYQLKKYKINRELYNIELEEAIKIINKIVNNYNNPLYIKLF